MHDFVGGGGGNRKGTMRTDRFGARRLALLCGALIVLPACGIEVDEAAAQDWRTVSSVRRAADAEQLRVDVEYGVGELKITPSQSDLLYKARMRYDAEIFRPRMDFNDGRLRVGLDGSKGLKLRRHDAGELILELGRDVPLLLDLKFGAAEANVELGGLQVRSARIATGASETTLRFSKPNRTRLQRLEIEAGAAEVKVYGLGYANADRVSFEGGMADVTLDFSGPWAADARASVKMGLGSITLRIPRDVGVRFQKSSIFASFDWDGFTKRGDMYFSENWADAEHKLLIDVESALGSIDIDWLEPAVAAAAAGAEKEER